MSKALVERDFLLSEAHDKSGLGVDMRWMNGAEMINEATQAYPGIDAVPRGFLPVGMCLEGTGDPYFLRLADGEIVRVPHDASRKDGLQIQQVELVADSIRAFVELAG